MKFLRAGLSARFWLGCSLACPVPGPALADAVPYSWRNAVIGGRGHLTGIEFHPRQAGLSCARTDVGGAYRRDKPGGPWIALNVAVGGRGVAVSSPDRGD